MKNIVKNTTLIGPLDLLFPHSCRGCGRMGEVLCEHCKNYIIKTHTDICPECKAEKTSKNGTCRSCPDLPPIYAVGPRSSLIGSLIHDYKYHSVRALKKPLAEFLNHVLPEDLPENTFLVPLPTATHHVRSRGFDHTLLIAKHLGKLRRLSVKKLLIRAKNTVQVGSSGEKRLSQAKQAYALNPKEKIDPTATYILIDDVWTTGSSVKAAKEKLEKAGAKNITIAVLAYSS